MKVYLHSFIVPTLKYKLSISILNLFIVSDLYKHFTIQEIDETLFGKYCSIFQVCLHL
jgi:riboflavin transporter FmnP